jgi:cytochrome c biogenesis protein CcmG, thiol:disulfide interchange protein DsbE
LGRQRLSGGERRLAPRVISKKLLLSIGMVVALGIVFLSRSGHLGRESAAQGNLAPNFSLPQLSGAWLELSNYRGKVVLLDFWATWCEPCREEIPQFIDLQKKYGPEGLQIIGVAMDDTPEPVRDFGKQFEMNYPVVIGNARIGELYGGVLGLPIAFLIARDGRISGKHIGPLAMPTIEKEITKLLQQ